MQFFSIIKVTGFAGMLNKLEATLNKLEATYGAAIFGHGYDKI